MTLRLVVATANPDKAREIREVLAGAGLDIELVARPDARVVIMYGDGSFGLHAMEVEAMARQGLPVVCIIGNDAAWGQMMRPQIGIYQRLVATELRYTRYDKVVEALGGHGEHVTQPADIRPALERAFASGKPALVNVEIEQDKEYKGGSYV